MEENPLAGAIQEQAQKLFDAICVPVFIVDETLRVWGANQAAEELRKGGKVILKRLCGEVFSCLHENTSKEHCGKTSFCSDCKVRNAALNACSGKETTKEFARMKIVWQDKERVMWLLLSAKPLHYEGKAYAVLTMQESTELMELREILPICMHCHKIRDDDQYWHRLESFMERHKDIKFSHGICPECVAKYYPRLSAPHAGEEDAHGKCSAN